MNRSIIGNDLPTEYLIGCGLTQNSTYQEVIDNLTWGTYGPHRSQPLLWVKLKECSTGHLINIIRTQPHVKEYPAFRLILILILIKRGLSQTHINYLIKEMPYEQLMLLH